MVANTGLLTPHLRPPASGTSQAASLRHAAFVRPCKRNPRGQAQADRGQEEVKIVLGVTRPRHSGSETIFHLRERSV
jgi:hypothetical protein